jgi:anti-anti-sigma regulatory factor
VRGLAQAAQESTAQGINLSLVGVTNSAVRDTVSLTGLSHILTAYRTLGAALETLVPDRHPTD